MFDEINDVPCLFQFKRGYRRVDMLFRRPILPFIIILYIIRYSEGFWCLDHKDDKVRLNQFYYAGKGMTYVG